MKRQITLDSAVRRLAYTIVAAVMMVALLPVLQSGKASAAQLTSRSITLSDSANSGTSITSGVGSGTNVTYQVAFTPTGAASSLVIDFCSQSPILADTCTAPTGMVATAATLNAAPITGTVDTGTHNWSVTAAAGQIKIHNDNVAGSNPTHDIQAAAPQVFEFTGITNPSTTGSFYARIYTYADNAYDSGSYTGPTVLGTYVDYGGIAMSTTSAITITARVQEQLTFCVTSADPATWTTTNDCSDTVVGSNPPAITLGHGSPTAVLDANATDTASIWTQLSTNATNGAVINLRNSNTSCGGLSADGGTTCAIPAINSGAATPIAFAKGSVLGGAGFGLYVDTYTPSVGIGDNGNGGVGIIGTVDPTATYNDGSNVASAPWTDGSFSSTPTPWFAMDTTTANNNTISTYGSTVASTSSPVYRAENQYIFAATAGLSTPAGIYTANMSLIATGTF